MAPRPTPPDPETRRNAPRPTAPPPQQRTGQQPPTRRAQPFPGGPGQRGGGITPPPLTRPGLRPGESAAGYDAWWASKWSLWQSMGWDLTNRELANLIKQIHWEFGGGEEGIVPTSMELERRGFRPTNLFAPPAGGGYRYGGGGGGMSRAEQLAQAEAAVRNASASFGAGLDDAAIRTLAKTVVDDNWSNDMLADHLVPLAVSRMDTPGQVSTGASTIKKMATDQLLTISDQTAREWSGRIASGEMTLEDVRALFSTQARQRYGWAAESIDAGLTVRDVLLPSRDRLANELEMMPEEIDLMDSKWLGMLQTADDKGQTRAATDSELIMRARKRPEWANTRNAAALAGDVTQMMRNMFGG